MNKLRSFIYLDNYKMYSISSQLFEGLTDYIVKTQQEKSKEKEHQKGPHFSGKVLANILEVDSSHHEKKFLHDFSYNLIEEELEKQGKILEINDTNVNERLGEINDYSFLKIRGKVIFNDMKMIEKTVSNFNSLGASLGYITEKGNYDEEMAEINNNVKDIKDRNQKAKFKHVLKNKASFEKHLEGAGLRMDPSFLEHLTNVLDFGYNQQFEIQIPIPTDDGKINLFSAQLIRENLKENEFTLIKKYSRQTEKEFTLFGILTQSLTKKDKSAIFENLMEMNDEAEDMGMKGAIMNLISHLNSLENTFTGKLDYEYAIDPVALYVEI